jgi:hypothetical protein
VEELVTVILMYLIVAEQTPYIHRHRHTDTPTQTKRKEEEERNAHSVYEPTIYDFPILSGENNNNNNKICGVHKGSKK